MNQESRQSISTKSFRDYSYRIGKRAFDFIVSFILLVCCLPLFLLISIGIAISSGCPVFYVQTRTGMHHQPFTIYKFRTMKQDARGGKHTSYEWKEGVPDHFTFKSGFDSSVTPIGKVLRKYSLDELPQLFNVLIGNMSIVGPRPEIPEITDHYSRRQSKRLAAKPGITGYAQINGRSEINHGQKIEYDLFYIENRTFLLDMKVILSTAMLVWNGKGAY